MKGLFFGLCHSLLISILLCIVGGLAEGGYVAVAVSDM